MVKRYYTYREHVLPCRQKLAERFPNAFAPKGAPAKRPLKVGITRDVLAQVKDLPRRVVRMAVADYCRGPKYTRAMIEGAVRVDLDGNPAGIVTDRAEAYAKAAEAARVERSKEFQRKQRRVPIDVAEATEAQP